MILLLALACAPDDVIPIPPSGWGSPTTVCYDTTGVAAIDVAIEAGGGMYAATFVGTPPAGPRLVAALPGAGHRAWGGTVELPGIATCAALDGWTFSVVLFGRGLGTSEAVCPENIPACP